MSKKEFDHFMEPMKELDEKVLDKMIPNFKSEGFITLNEDKQKNDLFEMTIEFREMDQMV